MLLKFNILGEPVAKQSARFKIVNNHIMSHKTEKVLRNEKSIAVQVLQQLPKGFKPLTGGIKVNCLIFKFPPIKSLPKKQKTVNGFIHKTTKPDLQDNLMKPLFDAMEKIVYLNDSQICIIENCQKIYNDVPGIYIELEEVC